MSYLCIKIAKQEDMSERLQKIWKFITDDMWHYTAGDDLSISPLLLGILKTISITVRGILNKKLTVRASALTYSSLLAVVPLLAIIFAIARGFGLDDLMEHQITQALGDNSEVVQTVMGFVNSYLEQTKNGVIIGVGIVVLLWTVFNLVNNIEVTFNNIWMVKKDRSPSRMFVDYLALLLFMPLLLLFSGALSIFISTLADQMESYLLLGPIAKFFVKLTPFVLTWFMFTALYMFIPNTKVKFRHAFLAGVLAGTVYQLFQYLYISGQIWVSKYNAIYGSFAALPLFLLWLQVSWTICLIGVELTYASQNLTKFDFEKETREVSRRYSDFVSLLILSMVAHRFEEGKAPYTALEISSEGRIPIRLTQQCINELVEINLLHEKLTEEDESTYLPSVDIGQLTVAKVLDARNCKGKENFKVDHEGRFHPQWQALMDAYADCYKNASQVLVKDLYHGQES